MSTSLEAVKALLSADVPVLLWGAPGTAKTASVVSLAQREDAHLVVLIGSTLEPSDVGGIPAPFEGQVVWSPPPWAREIRGALDAGRIVWLFLDELSCAPAAVQAVLLRVVQERKVAGLDISGVKILAAANPADSAADGGWLSPAMSNRFAHVQWRLPSTWFTGLLNRWGLGWADGGHCAAGLAAYLQANPQALQGVPHQDGSEGYASPRSWTNAVAGVVAVGGTKVRGARAVATACVGPAAGEWFSWVEAQDLPDPEEMLSGRVNPPMRPDQLRASLLAVAAAALRDHPDQAKRLTGAWEIFGKQRPDVAVAAATALLDGAPDAPLPTAFDALAEVIQAARSRAGV